MKRHTFYMVDVFAEEKYAGNQLAVVVDAADLSTEQMQKIANEIHFSETAFVASNKKRNDGYDVRIFTPTVEVPFAGHPALGTAWVINRFLAENLSKTVLLNLGVGQIPVVFKPHGGNEILWMKQVPPIFGKTFSTGQLAPLLGLAESDFDPRYPIQLVSTGLQFIIVPLKGLDSTKRAKVNSAATPDPAAENGAGILVFCAETYNQRNNLNVRVFVDIFGIPEDPATGSANGCLAAYLSNHKYFGSSTVEATVEQGCEIRRPSQLFLKAKFDGETPCVRVGGRVQLVGKGELG